MPVKALHIIIEVIADDQDDIQFLIRLRPLGVGEENASCEKEKGRPFHNLLKVMGTSDLIGNPSPSFLKKIALLPR